MTKSVPNYLIIGNGRLGRHLCHYMQLLQLPFLHWHRGLDHTQLNTLVSKATHIIVAINDDVIESFINMLPLNNQHVIHCSAALNTDAAFSAHPLQTFNNELYTLADYLKIPFIIDAAGPCFAELLPGLPNPHYHIDASQKAYYHALCVMANNFTTLLWQKAFNEFKAQLNIESHALFPLLERTVTNLQNDYTTALTGPLARGDSKTLYKNLSALQEDPHYDLFKAFIDTYQAT